MRKKKKHSCKKSTPQLIQWIPHPSLHLLLPSLVPWGIAFCVKIGRGVLLCRKAEVHLPTQKTAELLIFIHVFILCVVRGKILTCINVCIVFFQTITEVSTWVRMEHYDFDFHLYGFLISGNVHYMYFVPSVNLSIVFFHCRALRQRISQPLEKLTNKVLLNSKERIVI